MDLRQLLSDLDAFGTMVDNLREEIPEQIPEIPLRSRLPEDVANAAPSTPPKQKKQRRDILVAPTEDPEAPSPAGEEAASTADRLRATVYRAAQAQVASTAQPAATPPVDPAGRAAQWPAAPF